MGVQMKKEVKEVGGDSLGIRFTMEERRTYNIEKGDVIDLSDMTVERQTDENISNILAKQKQDKVKKKINKIMKKEMRGWN